MVVVNISYDGSTISNATVIISDHATPASGVYALYLRPETKVPEIWDFPPEAVTAAAADTSLAVSTGIIKWSQVFRGIKFNHGHTNRTNLKKAISYWTSYTNNSYLYLTVKDSDGTDDAEWPDSALAMQQIRCKITKIIITEDQAGQYYKFNLNVLRVTVII